MNLLLNGRVVSRSIVLGTLMLSALFLARGTTQLVAARFLPRAPVAMTSASHDELERPPGLDLPDAHAILARNIFDPATGSLWPPKGLPVPEADASAARTAELIDPNEIPGPCERPLRMIAATYSQIEPQWSFATLTTGADKPLLYRVGGKIEEDEIVAIYATAVHLRQPNGHLCAVQMFNDQKAVRPAATARAALPVTRGVPAAVTPSAGPAVAGELSEAELNQNIKALSETKYQIPRVFVDRLLRNPQQLMSVARVVPNEENGHTSGVKLYGIRNNSLLGKLGLQNGDVLRTINGYEMSSPDSALEAYAKLRSANDLTISVVRRGQPTSLDYAIQ